MNRKKYLLVMGAVYLLGLSAFQTVSANGTVESAVLDHIVIESAANGVGSEITTHTMTIGETFTVWAAGYDSDNNYISDQTVTWIGTSVVTDKLSPATGVSTTFTPVEIGDGTIHAAIDDFGDDAATITVKPGSPFPNELIRSFLESHDWEKIGKESFYWFEQRNTETIYMAYRKNDLGFVLFYRDYSEYDASFTFGAYTDGLGMSAGLDPYNMKNIGIGTTMLGYTTEAEYFEATIDKDNTFCPRLKENYEKMLETRFMSIAVSWEKYVFVVNLMGPADAVDEQMRPGGDIAYLKNSIISFDYSKIGQIHKQVEEETEETQGEEKPTEQSEEEEKPINERLGEIMEELDQQQWLSDFDL